MNYSHADVRHKRTVLMLWGRAPRCYSHRTNWGRPGEAGSLWSHSPTLAPLTPLTSLCLFLPVSRPILTPFTHIQFSFQSFLSPRLHACRARRFCLKETTQGQG